MERKPAWSRLEGHSQPGWLLAKAWNLGPSSLRSTGATSGLMMEASTMQATTRPTLSPDSPSSRVERYGWRRSPRGRQTEVPRSSKSRLRRSYERKVEDRCGRERDRGRRLRGRAPQGEPGRSEYHPLWGGEGWDLQPGTALRVHGRRRGARGARDAPEGMVRRARHRPSAWGAGARGEHEETGGSRLGWEECGLRQAGLRDGL